MENRVVKEKILNYDFYVSVFIIFQYTRSVRNVLINFIIIWSLLGPSVVILWPTYFTSWVLPHGLSKIFNILDRDIDVNLSKDLIEQKTFISPIFIHVPRRQMDSFYSCLLTHTHTHTREHELVSTPSFYPYNIFRVSIFDL